MTSDLLIIQNVLNDVDEGGTSINLGPAYAALVRLSARRSNPVIQISPAESEALEIRFLDDPAEVVVLRHGMGYPEGGLAVYSEFIDPGD